MSAPLSIIIPTLNEQVELPKTLDLLQREGITNRAELILADGGSTDDTLAIAATYGLTIVTSNHPQRAHQLNLGAKKATSDLLLFLHADTQIRSVNVDNLLRAMQSQPDLRGGGFLRRFDTDHWFLKIAGPMADRRSKKNGIFIGDQAIFCRRSTFETLGGYNETMDKGEDFEFSLRLRESGPVTALGPQILSSGRRFEKLGPVRQILNDRRWCLDFAAKNGWSITKYKRQR